jgi:hypothetical protein
VTAAESHQALQSFPFPTASVRLLLGIVNNGTPDLQAVNLTTPVTQHFRGIAARWASSTSDSVLRSYEAGYVPSAHELVFFEMPEDDQVTNFVKEFSSPTALPLFQADEAFISHMDFYALLFENTQGTQRVLFIRRTNKTFEITKSKFVVTLSGGQFTRVEGNTYSFDDGFDCVAVLEKPEQDGQPWPGFLFTSSQTTFERLFDYMSDIAAAATTTINTFVAAIPIQNEDAFRAAIGGDSRMLNKLARVSRKPYVATLSMDKVKEVIANFGLTVLVQESPTSGQEELIFSNNPQERWLILKLLDDDYLSSEMTTLRYETNSKSVRQG